MRRKGPFSHSPAACFPRISLLLGAPAQALPAVPLRAPQGTLSNVDSRQLTGQGRRTNQRSYTGSASNSRTENPSSLGTGQDEDRSCPGME